MESYYLPTLSPDLQTAVLAGREFHHCVHVMRHKTGDAVRLLDGNGGVYASRLSDLSRSQANVDIEHYTLQPHHSGVSLTVAIAPPRKPARLEVCLEKMTELGVARIIPLQCTNSEKPSLNAERAQHILVSAMKQSERVYLPELLPMTPFAKLGSILGADTWAGIAMRHPGSKPVGAYNIEAKSLVVVIGPEGDFTGEEFDQAISWGCVPLSLGHARLRTETAAIALTSVLSTKFDL